MSRLGRPTRSDEENQFNNRVAKRIASARIARGIMQGKLAVEVGISTSTLCYYESGDRRIPFSVLAELADRLGISLDELAKDARLSVNRCFSTRKSC